MLHDIFDPFLSQIIGLVWPFSGPSTFPRARVCRRISLYILKTCLSYAYIHRGTSSIAFTLAGS